MSRKFKFIIMLISLSISLSLMSNTYSRYVASVTGDINAPFSKWQILVNSNDITNNANSTITLTPTIEEQEHVASNVIAPSSKGYFDIDINPTNVDVSFRYSIELDMEGEDIPDLIITKYVILPSSYTVGDSVSVINYNGSTITNDMIFNKNTPSFRFESFTIRVYFEWYTGEDRLMNDEEDTAIGYQAANDDVTFNITANISFEQIIG